ncbi:hypothetical protein FNU79_09865 [Deinococcus detaillensis]|uniref:Uncharacterized protein n=1 Tax=Deinococcus detaillensis TaxID=2592048 RepID=A0A553UZ45_9DEIO|nr:hypothetical protein [Deinococcus detaillensis]TSA85493.1 hypothetical protein FNU79_09865 [Deinococcus detaillensis]
MRYFLPATPFWNGLSFDGDWSGEALGGQLSASASWAGPEHQSFSVTSTQGQRTLYTQYDASRTLTTGSRTAVLLAQQGFTAPTRGLRSITSTLVYADGDSSDTTYRVVSGDLAASGAFSPTWTWTAGTGGTLTNVSADVEGSTTFSSRNLAARARISVAGQFGGPRPGNVTLGATADHTETLRLSLGKVVPASTRYGLNASGTTSLSATEKVSAAAKLDSAGSYSLDSGLTTTRLPDWTGEVGVTVAGKAAFGVSVATPAALAWRVNLSRTGTPWSEQVGYTGSGGLTPAHTLNASLSYAPPRPAGQALSIQAGAGATWQRQSVTAQGGQVVPAWLASYRSSLGLSLSSDSWNSQLQLSLNAAPFPDAAGAQRLGIGGSLSGTVGYTRDPLTVSLNSNLNYAPSGTERWTGDIGVQALYKVSAPLQVSGNLRFRPGTVNSYQAGVGLRFTF